MTDVSTTIHQIVTRELSLQANKPSTAITNKDVAGLAKPVASAVSDEVNAVIENQTNQEPYWKSRVLRGAVIGLIGLVATVFNDYNVDGTVSFNDLYGYGATAFGFAFVIYGRLTGAAAPTI
jgi:hypothetical protein